MTNREFEQQAAEYIRLRLRVDELRALRALLPRRTGQSKEAYEALMQTSIQAAAIRRRLNAEIRRGE
jgi:hypothetical protein